MGRLHISSGSPLVINDEEVKKKKLDAAEFSPFWNQIVMNLREEDYISDLEQNALSMPEKSGCVDAVQLPLFLLAGKVSLAIKIAKSVPQEKIWDEISGDVYMKYAVEECFHFAKFILDDKGKNWVDGIYKSSSKFQLDQLDDFVDKISKLTDILNMQKDRNNIQREQRKSELEEILEKVIKHDFLGENIAKEQISISDLDWPTDPELRSQIERLRFLLTMDKSADHVPRNREARRRLEFFTNSLFMSMPETKPVHQMLSFSVLTPYYSETVLYSLEELQSSKDDGVTLIDYLKNLYPDEWTNFTERIDKRDTDDGNVLDLRLWASYRGQTLARTVRGTMYYQKALLLQAYREMLEVRGSGVDLPSTSRVPDVSMNIDIQATSKTLEKCSSKVDLLVKTSNIKLRNKENYNPWSEHMTAILKLAEVIGFVDGSLSDNSQKWKELDEKVKDWIMASLNDKLKNMVKEMKTAKELWETLEMLFSTGYQNKCFDKAKAYVDLKFTYVASCQIYGKQKNDEKFGEKNTKFVATDIKFLLKKNKGLRVAYIHEVNNKFYSKLVKADENGGETKVYSIELPGDPRLGEGKPENQNHAIVFTRGNAIQTIDMNQDNYFEESLKMRNLLEEFHWEPAPTIPGIREPAPTIHRKHVIRPTILGIREHIFTGSASSLASFMSNQETSFVTLGQRVIAKPLKVRMHYGHPDVFDRVFHITRGGISKASCGINISEDIYAGFNSTLRQGSVTHHEYIQVGKGRDVGFNQIAIFEGKVAGGNGEQVLSRDIYRLGQRFDFFRMLSFYYTTVGYYFSSLLMVITLYILLYGNLIMALSGTRVPHVLNDTDMTPELFLMIVLLPATYMVLVLYLEQGFEKAVESFLTMFSRLCSFFFAFSLGTRIHWFGRTIIHGGASYQATGRGFVLHHIKFSENYRLYSRSHFVKGMEVLFLLVVYGIYGFHSVRAIYNNLLLLGGLILSISWIVTPFLFDSSTFDLNKNLEDWQDWNDWLNRKSDEVDESKDIKDKVKESWEIWWNEELSHIRTLGGQLTETILCLRFFIFMYVVINKIYVQGSIKSLLICGLFWILFVVILLAYYKVLSNKKLPENVLWFLQVIHHHGVLATIGALAIAFFTAAYVHDRMFYNECYTVNVGDMLAFIIAFITTLWGILSICVAWKPKLVMGFAKIYDAGMGTLMFSIASMLSRRSIKQYLLRNMFDHNVSEYLQKSSAETARQHGRTF